MALSADPGSLTDSDDPDDSEDSDRVPDRNAQEWIEGFPRTFRAAEWIQSDGVP